MKNVKQTLEACLSESSKQSLLFSSYKEQSEWFKSMKQKSFYQPMIQEIIEESQKLLNETAQEMTFSELILFRDQGTRLEYERVYFQKRRRLNTFALMTLLFPENTTYREELHNIIWSICQEYTWCLPAHLNHTPEMAIAKVEYEDDQPNSRTYSIDLFAAETAFTLSEMYTLLKPVLDPLIQKRMVEEVFRRVINPFSRQRFEWESSTHNWAAVCAGSIGAAAIYLVHDEKRLVNILERVVEAMNCYLKGFHYDGTCLEGYGYWQYGFGYFTYFADLLNKRTDGKINFFESKKVHQIALFQQKCFLYQHHVVNFSDAKPKASVFLGLSHYLNSQYSDFEVPEHKLRAAYAEDHCSRWAPAFRNLLWFQENITEVPWKKKTYYLRDSQWFISRTDQFAFACKGGHNDEPHNHQDLGHFILQAKDEVFFKDLGMGIYTEDNFNENRYSMVCNGSQGHSVPIINHQLQKTGRVYDSTIRNVSIGDQQDVLEIDMTNAYSVQSLKELIRTFTWKKGEWRELVLSDRYQFSEQPEAIVERFIISTLQLKEDVEGLILQGKQPLKIFYDRELLTFDISEEYFINHDGLKEGFFMLDFTMLEPRKSCDIEWRFQFL